MVVREISLVLHMHIKGLNIVSRKKRLIYHAFNEITRSWLKKKKKKKKHV